MRSAGEGCAPYARGPCGSIPPPAGCREIDAEGLFVFPGLIDTHAHYLQESIEGYNMLIEGTFIGIICIIAFLLGRNLFDLDYNDPIIGRTMAFMTIGISQLAHAFNVRSEESIFKSGILGNAKLILATLMCTFLQVIVVFVEKLNTLFRTDQLNFTQWLIVLSLSILPTVVSEIEKKISKDKNQVLKAKNLNKIFL